MPSKVSGQKKWQNVEKTAILLIKQGKMPVSIGISEHFYLNFVLCK